MSKIIETAISCTVLYKTDQIPTRTEKYDQQCLNSSMVTDSGEDATSKFS